MLEIVTETDDVSGKTLITPHTVNRLINKGVTVSADPLEVRGLRWEIEFRMVGQLIGRIRKEDFLLAISAVPPG